MTKDCYQYNSKLLQIKHQNLKQGLKTIYQTSMLNVEHADLCAFPEFMMFYTSSSQSASTSLHQQAETINGSNLLSASMQKLQKQNSIQVVVGTIL